MTQMEQRSSDEKTEDFDQWGQSFTSVIFLGDEAVLDVVNKR